MRLSIVEKSEKKITTYKNKKEKLKHNSLHETDNYIKLTLKLIGGQFDYHCNFLKPSLK